MTRVWWTDPAAMSPALACCDTRPIQHRCRAVTIGNGERHSATVKSYQREREGTWQTRRSFFFDGLHRATQLLNEDVGGEFDVVQRRKAPRRKRVLEHQGENWHVGVRKRTGRGGRTPAETLTRFRSESGEVRYVKGMLHFRHTSQAALRQHLIAAAPAP